MAQRSLDRVLTGVFGLLVGLLVLVGGTGAAGLVLTEQSRARAERADGLRDSSRAMLLALADMETGVRGYRLARDRAFLEPYVQGRDHFTEAARLAREQAGTPYERELVERQVGIEQDWRAVYADPVSAMAPDEIDVDIALTQRNKRVADTFRAASATLDAHLAGEVADAEAGERRVRELALTLTLLALAAALVVTTVVARRATRALVGPLRALEQVLRRLTAGEHHARVRARSGPREVQAVARSVDELADEADRLREDADETARLREVANGIGRRTRDHIDPEQVLAEAVASLGEALAVDQAYVRLVDEDVLGPVAAPWAAPGRGPLEGRCAVGEDARWLRRLHDERQVLAVADLSADERRDRPGRAAACRTDGGALLAAPIAVADQLLGVLVLVGMSGARAWRDRELAAVQLVAADVGRALVLARLYRDQQALVARLQELDRVKTDFLSTVSHELRTPLTSIAGYLELIRDGDAGPVSGEQDAMLEVVDRNTHRLKVLIEDLLTLSRIESRAYTSERSPVDVALLVARAAETVVPAVSANGLDLVVEPGPDGATVLGDAGQLERVLLNLLSNAVKFTPAGGQVRVRAAVDGARLRLAVVDSGIGIPEDEQGGLFERFFRASNATAAAIQGTGLGLTIVRSIVENHDGELTLTSAAGRGTTVEVVLPLHAAAGPAGRTTQGTAQGTAQGASALSPPVVLLAH